MGRLLAYMALGMILGIGACSAGGDPVRAPLPADGQRQPAYVPRQVVVRLCAGVSASQLADALKKHRLSVAGRASAVILTLGWKDERSVEQVAAELASSTVFCATQPNYLYHTQPSGAGGRGPR